MSANDMWSADLYDRNARFVSDLGGEVLSWLNPRPGERILDLGCGDGALTLEISDLGADVVGVDSSVDMVTAARERGLSTRLGDATALDFDSEFDAVFSNAALHWAPQADNVASGIAKALKPGGRFVAEFGGAGNVAAIRTALIAVLESDYGVETDLKEVWYFPTPDEYAAVCTRAGLTVERIELIPRPTPVASGMARWLETLAAPALALLPDADRTAARNRVAGLVAPALRDDEGQWTADYVRLRVAATLSGTSV